MNLLPGLAESLDFTSGEMGENQIPSDVSRIIESTFVNAEFKLYIHSDIIQMQENPMPCEIGVFG